MLLTTHYMFEADELCASGRRDQQEAVVAEEDSQRDLKGRSSPTGAMIEIENVRRREMRRSRASGVVAGGRDETGVGGGTREHAQVILVQSPGRAPKLTQAAPSGLPRVTPERSAVSPTREPTLEDAYVGARRRGLDGRTTASARGRVADADEDAGCSSSFNSVLADPWGARSSSRPSTFFLLRAGSFRTSVALFRRSAPR